MKTIYEAFSDAQKALEELGAIVNATTKLEPEKPNAVFKPDDGKEYWYIECDGKALPTVLKNTAFDIGRYVQGNCYATQAEAVHVRERNKVLRRLRELADFVPDWEDGKYKYYPVYNLSGCLEWSFMTSISCIIPNTVYFGSMEELEAAIAELGDRMDYLLPYGVKK